MQKRIQWLLLAPAALATWGCDFDPGDWGPSDRYKEEFRSTHKLAPGGTISVEGFNGSIEVVASEGAGVEVAGSKYARDEDRMKGIRIDVDESGGGLRIRAIRPVEINCNCGVRFSLRVPKQVKLDDLVTSNGSVRIEGTEGPVRAKTSNGAVKIWRVKGEVNVKTSNASIEMIDSSGSASLETSNGRIKADGVRGGFDAQTSNASVDATILEMEAGKPVRVASSNGTLNLQFEKWNSNSLRATTSNSSINLRMPPGVNAELRASTTNGNVTADYDVAVSQKSKTRLSGRIGSGGPLLDLSTSNGNIRVTK
jgi:hypothetical protein